MKVNQLRTNGDGFPYDINLLKVVRSMGCFDCIEIMLVRCTTIIFYWKGAASDNA